MADFNDSNVQTWRWVALMASAGGVIDPVGPAQSELKARVLRGGGWDDDANHSRASQRGHCEPENIYGSFGFRAARTP